MKKGITIFWRRHTALAHCFQACTMHEGQHYARRWVLALLLAIICSGQAQGSRAGRYLDKKTRLQSHAGQSMKEELDGRIDFPYAFQIAPYVGMTQPIPQQTTPRDAVLRLQHLRFWGVSADVSVLQIRRFIWHHFHCYPKLGAAISYGRLENKGNIVEGLVYIEPQYDYLNRWEVFPRLGAGLLYASIPGTNFSKAFLEEEEEEEEEGEEEEGDDDEEVFYYQRGVHANLLLALNARIMLHPQWQLTPSIGFNYLPVLGRNEEDDESRAARNSIKVANISLGVSYIPRPSHIYYSPVEGRKRSRVDVGFLSGFKKFESKQLAISNAKEQHKDTEDAEGKYFYVGGIYGQWSLRVAGHHALTLATEWMKDKALEEAIKNCIRTDPWKLNFLVGHEFLWGKVIFRQQLGIYAIDNGRSQELPIKEQLVHVVLGLDYRITNALFVSANMRTNGRLNPLLKKLDFVDFRIGYSF